MDETHDGRFSGQHNQSQQAPGERIPSHPSGMNARERRYMRQRAAQRGAHALPASGIARLRIALLRPLLDETVLLDVETRWRPLFPDVAEVEEAVDVDVVEAASVEVDEVDAIDLHPDADEDGWREGV